MHSSMRRDDLVRPIEVVRLALALHARRRMGAQRVIDQARRQSRPIVHTHADGTRVLEELRAERLVDDDIARAGGALQHL